MIAADDDGDRMPALIGFARDDGADGRSLQPTDRSLCEHLLRDRFGTFAAHVRDDEKIFLRPEMRLDVFEQAARHFECLGIRLQRFAIRDQRGLRRLDESIGQGAQTVIPKRLSRRDQIRDDVGIPDGGRGLERAFGGNQSMRNTLLI